MRLVPAMPVVFTAAVLVAAAAEAGVPAFPFGTESPLVIERGNVPAVSGLRTSATPESLASALDQGADYLQAMQADITEDNAGNGTDGVDETPDDPEDGGWDWAVTSPPDPVSHTTGASPTNIYGVTALGLYYGYLATGDTGYLTAMADAANATLADSDIDSGPDIAFLQLYQDLPSVTGTAYEDDAKTKYDAKIATYGGAGALARFIRDVRNGQGYDNGIIPWDIAPWVVAARMLDDRFGGYAADADSMADVIWEDTFNANPGYFDLVADAGWDPGYGTPDYWWYNLGLTGIITAFAVADLHTSEIPGVVTLLLDGQFASGAVSFSYGANAGDEDWQSTAYAALALRRWDHAGSASEIADMGGWIADTQDALTGGWRYGGGDHYPEIAGENVCALWAAYLGANDVAAEPTGLCISTVDTCVTVPVVLTRSDTGPARGASVTIQLSSELELCGPIAQGTWLSSWSPSTVYHVVDNGGGSYTVDQSILGSPCGETGGGSLFEVPVKKSGSVIGDASGTITVTSVIVRDCENHPLPGIAGAPAVIPIDITGPAAVVDLSAVQEKVTNDTDGTTKIDLTLTLPGDEDEVFVYRKGYGDYPEYNDGTGAAPTPPTSPSDALANGWTLTGLTGPGADEPSTRDFWYYVVFTEDGCNNVSAVSNMTGGTLNYHLGDVAPSVGDNSVDVLDMTLLGASYGIPIVHGDPVNFLDVGPTTDFSVDALPTTDNLIGFEDLMMFAINHGNVSAPRGLPGAIAARPSAVPERPRLDLVVADGGRISARLFLRDHEAAVKGLHTLVSFDRDALELVSVSRGELIREAGTLVFFATVDHEDGVVVDAAVMGGGLSFSGTGEIARLEFAAKRDGALPTLARAVLRDRENRAFGDRSPLPGSDTVIGASEAAPATASLELVGARPNPFAGSTEIVFRLPDPRRVEVSIHDVSGRLVRTLTDRTLAAGEHRAVWDGRTADGSRAGTGVYFYTFRAGDRQETRKLLHVR